MTDESEGKGLSAEVRASQKGPTRDGSVADGPDGRDEGDVE